MSEEFIKDKRKRLSKEKKQEYKEKLASVRKEIKRNLHDQYEDVIRSQIRKDVRELADFNIIISCFLNQEDTHYQYIRTEPLFHEKEKNFDILVASKKKKCAEFIEIERSLVSDLSRRVSEFLEQKKVIEERNPESFLNIEKYLTNVLGFQPKIEEFVISSNQISDSNIKKIAEKRGINILAWGLAKNGPVCKIHYVVGRKDKKEPFQGHKDEDLKKFISDVLLNGVDYNRKIDFTYSSCRYLKLKNMSSAILQKKQRAGEGFNFEDWKKLFKIELSNYNEREKKTIFNNFIKYGQKCAVVDLLEDKKNLHKNIYRIRSKATVDEEKIENEIIEKMIKYEMEDELEEKLKEEKKDLIIDLQREEAIGAGKTISDFEGKDNSENRESD